MRITPDKKVTLKPVKTKLTSLESTMRRLAIFVAFVGVFFFFVKLLFF